MLVLLRAIQVQPLIAALPGTSDYWVNPAEDRSASSDKLFVSKMERLQISLTDSASKKGQQSDGWVAVEHVSLLAN